MSARQTAEQLLNEGLPLEALRQAWEATQYSGQELVKAFRTRDTRLINQRLKDFEESHSVLLSLLKGNVELLQEAAELQKETIGMTTPLNRHVWRQHEINAQAAEAINVATAGQGMIVILMMMVFIFVIGSLMKAFWFN